MKLLKLEISNCQNCPYYSCYKGRDILGNAIFTWSCTNPITGINEIGEDPIEIPAWCALEEIEAKNAIRIG